MKQLKIITLDVRLKSIDGTARIYSAIDDNGKQIGSSREESRASNGLYFIAALVTKNSNHLYQYSIKHLFTTFDKIHTKSTNDNMKPYAIAVLEQYKQAYQDWINNPKGINKPLVQILTEDLFPHKTAAAKEILGKATFDKK